MTEENSPGTPKEQLRANHILFNALFIGVALFLVISIGLIKWNVGGFLKDDTLNKYFLIAAGVVAVICLMTATSGYKNRVQRIANSADSLNEKLNNYRAAMILYLATCEGAALFSVIGIFITGNYWLVSIVLIMLVAMLFKRPTKQRVINDLQLDWQQQQEL